MASTGGPALGPKRRPLPTTEQRPTTASLGVVSADLVEAERRGHRRERSAAGGAGLDQAEELAEELTALGLEAILEAREP